MRPDMSKVLVERPRRGRSWTRCRRRSLHQDACRRPDDVPRRESIGGRRRTKSLNENLAPLERYLRSQIGRPWDKVYSEICERLRPTNAVQQHVRDHLQDFVATRTWIEDGELFLHTRTGRPRALADWGPDLYVCPRTGLLRGRQYRRPRHVVARDPDVRWDGAWRQLRRVAGIWYALRLVPIPASAGDRAEIFDRWLGRRLEDLLRTPRTRDPLTAAYGRRDVYAAEKRQLSKRELRRLEREC